MAKGNKMSTSTRTMIASLGVMGGLAVVGAHTNDKKNLLAGAIIGGVVLFGITYLVERIEEKNVI